MSSHIIVVTHLEEPRVYLSTNATFEILLNSLRGDPHFCYKRSNVYALQPDPDPEKHPTTLQAIRLMKVGSTDNKNPAQAHFQEALHHAELMGETNYKIFLTEWKTFIERLLRGVEVD